jgi:cytochrome c oxidase cbb3-type subunit 3
VAASAAPPPVPTPVGPVPGAEQNPARRDNPYHGNVAAMTEGRTLFVRMNCSGCHGGRAGGGMGPSLRDVDWIYGSTDAQIFDSIAEGRAYGMPSWGTALPEDQIWKLVAYVKSLRTPDEPHPPS